MFLKRKQLHNLYILNFSKNYMTVNRLKRNKQRGMNQRLRGNKKPMSPEQKEERKRISEADRARSKTNLAKR